MAREGGYGRNTKAEWLKTDRNSYADALTSSRAMGQELETWLADAIAFHAYHCEAIQLREQYNKAEADARARNNPSVDPAQFRPQRPEPTISQAKYGQGSGGGRNYRP